jgi:hypothetical protein
MRLFSCREPQWKKGVALLSGMGLGAALMYVLDPERGRRRALARDKAVRLANRTSDRVGATSRDLGNRARGVAAELRGALRGHRSEQDEERPPLAVSPTESSPFPPQDRGNA